MEIITCNIVISTIDKPFRLFLCFLTIESDKRWDVELQTDTYFVKTLVVVVVHIAITLRVGKEHIIALALDAVEDVPEIHGDVVIACVNKELVAIVANG